MGATNSWRSAVYSKKTKRPGENEVVSKHYAPASASNVFPGYRLPQCGMIQDLSRAIAQGLFVNRYLLLVGVGKMGSYLNIQHSEESRGLSVESS
jgi:hypothetical protein